MSFNEARLGKMLADRYLMHKEAAANSVGKAFQEGISGLGTGLAMAVPALALAGGVHLIRKAIKERDRKKLEIEADKVFSELKKAEDPSILKDPRMAEEAFNSLKKFAPNLAVRPLLARTFLKGVTDTENFPHETALSLLKTERMYQEVEEGHADPMGGFMEGLEGPMDLMRARPFDVASRAQRRSPSSRNANSQLTSKITSGVTQAVKKALVKNSRRDV